MMFSTFKRTHVRNRDKLTLLRAKPIIVVYCEIRVHVCVSVLRKTVFANNSSEFDKQEGFSSEQCVVEYKNAVYSGLMSCSP